MVWGWDSKFLETQARRIVTPLRRRTIIFSPYPLLPSNTSPSSGDSIGSRPPFPTVRQSIWACLVLVAMGYREPMERLLNFTRREDGFREFIFSLHPSFSFLFFLIEHSHSSISYTPLWTGEFHNYKPWRRPTGMLKR
ncbi:hypothetical protein TNIN_306071 [Trichonephila inaurata madagascariensis]|uniref:Uncharacterized protein n=1 Tax=Trichonephila inaurata madagascariensis TaxID=2747483 RepID=A0A8X6YM04_9ARAC|nr:hypothetical protein TNIN_306071 [Trichonephila inaurata madagascariensis]